MAGLRSLDVQLEAVTPLWIGGASLQAELRPPSVRGCLRFWFRALAGGLMGEVLNDVKQAEGGCLREHIALLVRRCPPFRIAENECFGCR